MPVSSSKTVPGLRTPFDRCHDWYWLRRCFVLSHADVFLTLPRSSFRSNPPQRWQHLEWQFRLCVTADPSFTGVSWAIAAVADSASTAPPLPCRHSVIPPSVPACERGERKKHVSFSECRASKKTVMKQIQEGRKVRSLTDFLDLSPLFRPPKRLWTKCAA